MGGEDVQFNCDDACKKSHTPNGEIITHVQRLGAQFIVLTASKIYLLKHRGKGLTQKFFLREAEVRRVIK